MNSQLRESLLDSDVEQASIQVDHPLREANDHLKYYRRAAGLLAVLHAVAVTTLHSVSVGKGQQDARFVFDTSTLDCAILSCVVSGIVLLFLVTQPRSVRFVGNVASYALWLSSIYAGGKAIALSWDVVDGISQAAVVASAVTPLFLLYLLYLAKSNFARVQELQDAVKSGASMDPPAKTALSTSALLKVMKPYFWPRGFWNKVRCVSTWVFLFASKTCNLMSPIYIGRATNLLRNHGDINDICLNILIYTALSFSSKTFKEMQNMVYLKVKQTAYTEIAESTFNHLHSLSLEWHLKKKMGNVLRSMDRGVLASNTVVTYLFLSLGPSLGECVAVFVIFYVHFGVAALSAAAFVSIALYALVTIEITLWRKKFRKLTNKHDNDYHDKATDSLINYETVKYFTAEEFEVNRYINSVRKFQKYSVNTQLSLSLLNISQQFINNTCAMIALVVAAHQVYNQEGMDVGQFVSVNMYIVNLFAPLSFLGTVYNAVIQAFVDMSNLSELLAESPDVVDARDAKPLNANPNGQGASVEFRDIYFHYPTQDSTSGLQGVSFTVKPGTVTAIVGKTGAGKTTISRLLFRFYDPLAGQVLISNSDIVKVTQRSLRENIAVVPQDTVMFNDTIRHNILYGRLELLAREHATGGKDEYVEAELRKACEQAQILEFIENLPEGFNTMVGERGLKLSGGEKQRVSIARALLKNSDIVLLDEATSALDSRTERSVQAALNNLTSTRTTLVIAHRLSTIRKADQIVVLEKGKIIEKGSHDELMAKGKVYWEMWDAQLHQGEDGEE